MSKAAEQFKTCQYEWTWVDLSQKSSFEIQLTKDNIHLYGSILAFYSSRMTRP